VALSINREQIKPHRSIVTKEFQPLLAAVCGLLFLIGTSWRCVSASLLDESFDVGTGPRESSVGPAPGGIRAMALQPDGKIVVGGTFTSFNGSPCDGIVRLNSDGSVDKSFQLGSGKSTSITSLTIQRTGEILVGGFFDDLYGKACRGLVRLKADGSLDDSFLCNSNQLSGVFVIAVQSDGNILVGGYDGVKRLLPDGQLDPTFAATELVSSPIGAIIQLDGKIVASGPPTIAGPSWGSKNLLRLNPDGSLDPTFLIRTNDSFGPESFVTKAVPTFAIEPDGKILAGGWFYGIYGIVNGIPYSSLLLRFNVDGTLDPTFGLQATGWHNPLALLARPDGRIVIVSGPMTIDGVRRLGIAQLLPGGILDTEFHANFEFQPEPPFEVDFSVNALLLQPDGKAIVAGQFTSVDGIKRMGMARLRDSSPTNLNILTVSTPGLGPNIAEANTNVLVEVTRAGDPNRRITVDYLTRDSGATAGEDYLPVAGTLTFELGERRKTFLIPILDDDILETNETFTVTLANPSDGVQLNENSSLEITIVDDDNFSFRQDQYFVNESAGYVEVTFTASQRETLYVIGYQPVDDTAKAGRDYLAQTGILKVCDCWQQDGMQRFSIPILDNAEVDGDRSFRVTLRNLSSGLQLGPRASAVVTILDDDTAAGPAKGFKGTVQTSALQPDGRLLVGGWFTSIDGTNHYYIARLNPDGSNDVSFNPGKSISGPVLALALQSDGKIVIGGRFDAVGGVPRPRVARLNSDGLLDTRFDPGTNWSYPDSESYVVPEIHAVVVQGDGKILLGGTLTAINGAERRGITRLNPDGSLDEAFVPQLSFIYGVKSLALQDDGKILAGSAEGNYVNGNAGLQRLNPDGSRDEAFPIIGYAAVPAVLVQRDGRILFGHQSFGVSLVGVQKMYIHRLNSDGSEDASFTGFGNAVVFSFLEQPDGKLLLAGSVDGKGLIRLNADGTQDDSFKLVKELAPFGRTLNVLADGTIFLGGTFNGRDFEALSDLYRHPDWLGGYPRTFSTPAYFFQRIKPDGGLVNDLRFDGIKHLPDGQTHLSLAGQFGSGFSVEAASNLRDWLMVGTNSSPNTGLAFRDLTSTNSNQRFYRIR